MEAERPRVVRVRAGACTGDRGKSVDYLRVEQHLDLVVSGTTSRAVPVRSTSSVAAEVIRHARANLLVVSFAAYGVKEIVQELKLAAGRGVRLALVLETSTSAVNAFEGLGPSARLWHSPTVRSPTIWRSG